MTFAFLFGQKWRCVDSQWRFMASLNCYFARKKRLLGDNQTSEFFLAIWLIPCDSLDSFLKSWYIWISPRVRMPSFFDEPARGPRFKHLSSWISVSKWTWNAERLHCPETDSKRSWKTGRNTPKGKESPAFFRCDLQFQGGFFLKKSSSCFHHVL